MRPIKSAQTVLKVVDEARLQSISVVSRRNNYFAEVSYRCIVTLLSLENMRKSERVVMLDPTTSTFSVVLFRYSCTLNVREFHGI